MVNGSGGNEVNCDVSRRASKRVKHSHQSEPTKNCPSCLKTLSGTKTKKFVRVPNEVCDILEAQFSSFDEQLIPPKCALLMKRIKTLQTPIAVLREFNGTVWERHITSQCNSCQHSISACINNGGNLQKLLFKSKKRFLWLWSSRLFEKLAQNDEEFAAEAVARLSGGIAAASEDVPVCYAHQNYRGVDATSICSLRAPTVENDNAIRDKKFCGSDHRHRQVGTLHWLSEA